MKKCARCTKFCPYIKGRYSWNEVDKEVSFLSESANCFVSDRLGRNFPTVQNGPKKRKNLYLIKQVSKWKRAIGKELTSFLLFHFWGLKWVPIDSPVNSASENLTYCFQKCRCGTKKSSQTWESGLKPFWNVLCDL